MIIIWLGGIGREWCVNDGAQRLTTGRTASSKEGAKLNQGPHWSRGRVSIHDKSENVFKYKFVGWKNRWSGV